MHRYRLLKEPVEEHSPGSRPSAVKSEGKFVQIGLHMIRAERALVGTEQPPFHERHHAVYTRKNFVRIHAGTLDRCASMNIVIFIFQGVERLFMIVKFIYSRVFNLVFSLYIIVQVTCF
jgi:hypothetical protein